ncbi:hypothetical protein IAD21_02378 [Abditibacteriota bacterium]|nr:hypothetical protein IAD21_02378 [Abditibacteriota bacterium]
MKSTLRKFLSRNQPRTAPELTFADYVAERLGIWSEAPPVPGALVFLGDSQIERGRWNEWWPQKPILNRGIGGETIAGVAARLDEVIRHVPPLIVLECGANDLAESKPLNTSVRDFSNLLSQLRARLPDCTLWIQGVLPAHRVQWRDRPPTESTARALALNSQVRALNEQLEDQSRSHKAFFLNLHPSFEAEGMLRAECTLDGLHLNGTGYRVWREALQHQAPPEIAAILGSSPH